MIDGRNGNPGRRCVTVFADVRRQYMRWAFAGRFGTVMTADAVVRDVHMGEVRR